MDVASDNSDLGSTPLMRDSLLGEVSPRHTQGRFCLRPRIPASHNLGVAFESWQQDGHIGVVMLHLMAHARGASCLLLVPPIDNINADRADAHGYSA